MTYNVEGVVTRVFITPCGSNGRPDALRIGSSSTYCGVKSHAWDQRTDPKQLKKQLVHNPGCVFDLSDDLNEAKRLLGNPVMSPDLSEEEKDDIRRQFDGFHNDLIRGIPTSSRSSLCSTDSSSGHGFASRSSSSMTPLPNPTLPQLSPLVLISNFQVRVKEQLHNHFAVPESRFGTVLHGHYPKTKKRASGFLESKPWWNDPLRLAESAALLRESEGFALCPQNNPRAEGVPTHASLSGSLRVLTPGI
ncbi:hypothetical protein NM208_g9056 [Fusarium decemcellulare]|uniref:Uncharacterized protein n=1 Tax=Fusarium decemcellulare TaxID=57161 RepID=A0ACC1S312_9HYPO|nr:hypothetical protein NM208_g9056 [Fusarium decemcellulare]